MKRYIILFVGIGSLSLPMMVAYGRPHHRPPQEAIDACEGLKSGDSCSFESPDGELLGSCFSPEADKPLACRPDDAAGQQPCPRRPPEEAIDACEGLKAGDSCSFESPEGEVAGSCFSPDADKPLACRPANAPEKGRRGPPRDGKGQGAKR